MANRARLDWNGDKLIAQVEEATRAAINDVTAEAADDARATHSWVSRTGNLETEIVTEDAADNGDQIVGRFGTTRRRGFYGLFHEEGTKHEYERPFLRPAADRAFPTLADRIARRLRGRP